VHEAAGGLLRAIRLSDGAVRWLGTTGDPETHLVPSSTRAGAGMRLRPGLVLLAPGGRPGDGDVTMIDPETGSRSVVRGLGR
jgi:hypothetical protein